MFTIETGETRTFEFSIDGKEYEVPLLSELPIPTVKEFLEVRKSADGAEAAIWLAENVFEAYAPGCTEHLKTSELAALVGEYAKESSLGE